MFLHTKHFFYLGNCGGLKYNIDKLSLCYLFLVFISKILKNKLAQRDYVRFGPHAIKKLCQ